ncbi:MAG: aminopeptidase [Deltaproteobacteria bacterium]|nr:aminopeptidase [Deltaproteobacteria bacterium]
MKDSRVEKLADILVNYSAKVKKGDTVLVRGDELGKPLILEVYRKVIEAGGNPLTSVSFDEMNKIFYDSASKEQLSHTSKIKLYEAKNCDAVIIVHAPANSKSLTTVNPAKMTMRSKANKPISEIIVNKKRWVLTNYPTQALAQDAEMSIEEYEDFLFNATNLDWVKVDREQERIKKVIDKGRTVRIVGKNTDLTFSIKGRKGIKCSGSSNMPDGEIFYAPVEDSANGHIYYEFPAIHGGKEVTGIHLGFEKGKVVKATAEKNEEYLFAMLDTDKGARYLGEFGIGTNYGIKRFTRDILFDEKIGGTVHLALGRSYKESGGKNDSAIHWDMIKELREDGALYLDGKRIQENGKFLI